MYAFSTVTAHFTGLNPGDRYAASFQFHYGAGGEHSVNEGVSANVVQADGSITFAVATSPLTQGHAGALKAWVRPDGSDFDAPPVHGTDGPCVVKLHLP